MSSLCALPIEAFPVRLNNEQLKAVGRRYELGYTVIADLKKTEICSPPRIYDFLPSSILRDGYRHVASIFSEAVKSRQLGTIQHNSADLAIEVAKHFVKSQVLPQTDPVQKELKRDITAARLGITTEVLDQNPGFQEFAEKSHLHRYLLTFKQQLHVDPSTKQISILCQRRQTPWTAIASEIKYEQDKWAGHYSAQGIQFNSRYDWERLQPCMTGNPDEWGNQYVFEYVVWNADQPALSDEPKPIDDQPHLMGVHTYFHLKTPEKEDNIYSVGLYRPNKQANPLSLAKPLRVRKAKLMSPDESDFWGGRFTTLTKAITKEQFLAIKAKVEKDHASKKLSYHITHENCNEYTGEVAKLAGINIPSFLPIASLILPISEKTAGKFPTLVRKIAAFVATTSLNVLGAVFGGATCVDPEATCSNRPAHITSIKDLFDETKANFSHPHALQKAFKEIESWRTSQIAILEQRLDAELDADSAAAIRASVKSIQFAIPDHFEINK